MRNLWMRKKTFLTFAPFPLESPRPSAAATTDLPVEAVADRLSPPHWGANEVHRKLFRPIAEESDLTGCGWRSGVVRALRASRGTTPTVPPGLLRRSQASGYEGWKVSPDSSQLPLGGSFSPVMFWKKPCIWLLAAMGLLAGNLLAAAEWRSNGRGGGAWMEGSAWQGGRVPGERDTVRVVSGDQVVYAGLTPTGRLTCAGIFMETNTVLEFKADGGHYVLRVAGAIRSSGTLRLDASKTPKGMMELHLVGEREDERMIHLLSNSLFVAHGATGLPERRNNVLVCTGPPRPGQIRRSAVIKGEDYARVDLSNVGLAYPSELHSNGRGGGAWTDPLSWREKIVPFSADTVILTAGDTVEFDGDGRTEASCRRLLLDPQSTLTFRDDGETHVLSINGGVESYGLIRLDGRHQPQGVLELRLVSGDSADNQLICRDKSALFLAGHESPVGGRPNVRMTGGSLDTGRPKSLPLRIEAGAGVQIDCQRSEFSNVVLRAEKLDNTGVRSDERMQLTGNRFMGAARVELVQCDTPVIQKNIWVGGGTAEASPTALKLDGCSLAQLQYNTFSGAYERAVWIIRDTDSSAMFNEIVGANQGFDWQGQNAMLKSNRIRVTGVGATFDKTPAVIESSTIEGKVPLLGRQTHLQVSDCALSAPETNGPLIRLESASATILNVALTPGQVQRVGTASGPFWVETMNYVVVRLRGTIPVGARVAIRTAKASGGPPAGAADMNVRNSPVPVSTEGWTPLPRSLRALIVRAWSVTGAGVVKESPFYDLDVTAADPTGSVRVVSTQVVEPKTDWIRPDPQAAQATVEVSLP